MIRSADKPADTEARRDVLERLYAGFNRRDQALEDPVHTLYGYREGRDCEVAGLVASCLAYGRVAQIIRSVRTVLGRMGASPAGYLASTPPAAIRRHFAGFKHRFTTGAELAGLLTGVRRVVGEHGSLERCFAEGMGPLDETVLPALSHLVGQLVGAGCPEGYLLSDPRRGSACKRLNLFLRWMVRRDEVDLGVWASVPQRLLVVPLDVHMHRLAGRLGLTRRRSADLATAREVTEAFGRLSPADPVRYDFALTRLSIVGGEGLEEFVRRCGGCEVRRD